MTLKLYFFLILFLSYIFFQIGRKTDVWSLGCILYYFLYKKTPYQDIIKPLLKLKSITDPNYVVPFPKIDGIPDILIESCKRCLIHDTKQRASIEELLALRNRPLFSLSQILGRLEKVLPQEHYKKAAKAFEGNDDGSDDQMSLTVFIIYMFYTIYSSIKLNMNLETFKDYTLCLSMGSQFKLKLIC